MAVSTAAVWTAGRATPVWAQDLPFAPESYPDYYPPALTGLRGSHVGSFEAGHALRDGTCAEFQSLEVDTGETYDLVVVGGGLSGLSAAYFFQKNLGADRNVLILDNHDDFGGHAKRNEFTHDGRIYIGYGGTQGISTPFPFSHAAKSLIAELGIEVERYPEFVEDSMLAGLGRAVFFDRETFGADRLVVGEGDLPWDEFFARAPFSSQARADLVRIHTQEKDYLPELTSAEKRGRLAKMSYRDYLLNVAGVSEEAVKFFLGDGGAQQQAGRHAAGARSGAESCAGHRRAEPRPQTPVGGQSGLPIPLPGWQCLGRAAARQPVDPEGDGTAAHDGVDPAGAPGLRASG